MVNHSPVDLLDFNEYKSSTVNLEGQLGEMIDKEAQHENENESGLPKIQEARSHSQEKKELLVPDLETISNGASGTQGWTEIQLHKNLTEDRWVMTFVYKGNNMSFEMDGKGPTKVLSIIGNPFSTETQIEQSGLLEHAIRMWNDFAPKDFFRN